MKKQMAVIIAALGLCVNAPGDSFACYTAREFEAEQGLRIHSELMVIGLTCQKMPGGEALYRKYEAFTQKNSDLIATYERDLIRHYSDEGDDTPEQTFNTLRTGLANEISQHAIAMNVADFCRQFAVRLDQALDMDRLRLRRWAQHVWPGQALAEPLCRESNALEYSRRYE